MSHGRTNARQTMRALLKMHRKAVQRNDISKLEQSMVLDKLMACLCEIKKTNDKATNWLQEVKFPAVAMLNAASRGEITA